MEKRNSIFIQSFYKTITSLVYSNIWVSISVASLAQLTFVFYKHSSTTYLLFCLSSTLFAYGYARLFETSSEVVDEVENISQWTVKYKIPLRAIASLGLIFAFASWWALPTEAKIALLFGAVIAILYPIPQIFASKGLRYLAGFKLIVIALVWTLTTLTVPAVMSNAHWDLSLILYHLERMAFILALTIPFDIRDASTDPKEIQTLPLWLGVRKSKQIGMILTFIAISSLILRYSISDTSWFIPHLFIYLLTAAGNYFASDKRHDMYYSFWLEGLPILLLLAVLLFELI